MPDEIDDTTGLEVNDSAIPDDTQQAQPQEQPHYPAQVQNFNNVEPINQKDSDGRWIPNPDGSLTLSNKSKVFPDGHIEYLRGDKVYAASDPWSKAQDITPKTTKIQSLNPDGTTSTKLINATTGDLIKDLGASKGVKPEDALVKEIGSLDIGEAKGQEVLDKIPANLQPTIQAIAEYRYPKLSSFALRSPYFQKMLSIITAYDPSFDVKNYDQKQRLMNNFGAGKTADNINSLNTVIGHIGTLKDSFDQLGNLNSAVGLAPAINYAKNSLASGAGYASPNKFAVASNTVATEISRALQGGVPNQTEINEWKEKFGKSMTPDAFNGTVQEAINLLSSRLNPLYSQYKNIMGKDVPYSLLTPESQSVLQKLGDAKTIQRFGGDKPLAPALSGGDATPAPAIAPPSLTGQDKAIFDKATSILASDPTNQDAIDALGVLKAKNLIP